MIFNNFFYYVVESAQFVERLTKGYAGGNKSTDNSLIIGDKKDQILNNWINTPTLPSYILPSEVPNWPRLSHEEAHNVVNKQASAKFANDGWFFSEHL